MPAIRFPLSPTATIRSTASLAARQDSSSSATATFISIPSAYGSTNSSPHPAVVAGIVLGSVAGFLLLLYIIYAILHGGPVLIPVRGRSTNTASTTLGASTLGTSTLGTETSYASRSVLSFRSRRDRRRRSRSARETVEVHKRSRRRPGEPPVVSPPRSPSPVSTAPPRVVPASEVSALSSLDEIVVEEEHSPPRRQSSRRHGSPERGYRRGSAYRDGVDTERYHSRRDSPPRRGSRRY
ncbi:hypothetical protein QQX98_004017 [Neonectria punicea]|uniref:Uncharacterized protein n=1 Tax=Neonectria punicea TaxID=979145 RepID=A0ABR1HC09_9HYPO